MKLDYEQTTLTDVTNLDNEYSMSIFNPRTAKLYAIVTADNEKELISLTVTIMNKIESMISKGEIS